MLKTLDWRFIRITAVVLLLNQIPLHCILSISIFPNPTDGHLSIDLSKTSSEANIKILDLFGKELKSMKFYGNKLIDFQFEEPPGIYLIMVENGTQKSVVKVIKSNSQILRN